MINWGIIGPGWIANSFANGLKVVENANLVAVAGSNSEKRNKFADNFGINEDNRYEHYQELLNKREVDVVYIATPHPSHAQIAIDALRAKKHVLCEKPLGIFAEQVHAIAHVAREENLFLNEGFMYLCHPQIKRLMELIQEGVIGKINHIEAAFCFDSDFDPKSRLYDPNLAGGAILDVGCYPVSFARLVVGMINNENCFVNPIKVAGAGRKTKSNVDQSCYAVLEFENNITAYCETSISGPEKRYAKIYGDKGTIELANPWDPGVHQGPADTNIIVTVDGKATVEEIKYPDILFSLEAQMVTDAINNQQTHAPFPSMNLVDSIGNAETLDLWRKEVSYELTAEQPATNKPLTKVIINNDYPIPKIKIEHLDKEVTQLILGCDNQLDYAKGAVMWDAWLEVGGNAFDTAYIYGDGVIEKHLGNWIKERQVAKEVTVVVKGAHTPCCDPVNLKQQLTQSLNRLQLDCADIYLMHRDNLNLEVAEFIDCLNELVEQGLIKTFGVSNWTLDRFIAANEYAKQNNKRGFTILNNNLSLAVMEKVFWAGCVNGNDAKLLQYLSESKTVHLSWSSQARGFFFQEDEVTKLPPDSSPEVAYFSDNNHERRNRARKLAKEKNVSANNIAAAWVLNQDFPSLALIGARHPHEITSSLPALSIKLTQDEIAWLNLDS